MTTLPAPMLLAGDEPRTRLTDPVESHEAADRSQGNLSAVRTAVLRIVAIHQPVIGSEVNDLYDFDAARGVAPVVHWDSPRKRLSWLHDNGFIEVVGSRRGATHTREREFAPTQYGMDTLGL